MGVVARAIFYGVSQGVLSLGHALDPMSSLKAIKKAAKPIAPHLAKQRQARRSSTGKLIIVKRG